MAAVTIGTSGGGYNNQRGANLAPYSYGYPMNLGGVIVNSFTIQIASYSGTATVYGCIWNSSGNLIWNSAASNPANDTTSPVAAFTFSPGTFLSDAYYFGFSKAAASNVMWDVQQPNTTYKGTYNTVTGDTVLGSISGTGTAQINRQLVGTINYTDVSAPTISSFSINPGNGSLTLNFSGSDGGLGSTWNYSLDNVNWSGAISSGHAITGLSNGTSYTVYLRYYNAKGTASTSGTSTPYTIPGAPSVSSTPSNGKITVSYSAPASNGGESIDAYQYSLNNTDPWTNVSSPFDISGTNGTSITVYVRAVNAAGGGPSASTINTPRTVPTAPTSFSANNSVFGKLSLSWSAPTNNGGSAVTGYTLKCTAPTGAVTTFFTNSNQLTYTHEGLLPYTDYTYTVSAVNAAVTTDGITAPVATITQKTMGGIAKVFNDLSPSPSYVTVLPKVYNGSTWLDAQARIYDGIGATEDAKWKHGI